MTAKYFMMSSAGIVFLLGAIHLAYTFVGTLLTPRDPELRSRMEQVCPVISKETTMWRCWVGFNTTHGMCLIFFGLIFG